MGDNGDARPFMSATLGSVDVMVSGDPGDELDDVREQFDHAFDRALDAADDLSDTMLP